MVHRRRRCCPVVVVVMVGVGAQRSCRPHLLQVLGLLLLRLLMMMMVGAATVEGWVQRHPVPT